MIARAIVAVTALACVLLLAGLPQAGLAALLCVPLARNVAIVIVDRRAQPRVLAIVVSLALLVIYGFALWSHS